MLITETKIKEIVRVLIVESDEQKVREHNYLVSLVRSYNSIPSNQTNKRRELFKQIQNKAKILKYSVGSEGNIISVSTNGKPIKTIADRTSQEEISNYKTLVDYPTEFKEFVKTLFNTGGLVIHNLELGVRDPEQAQRNIIQGKKTVSSNTALESLYNMFVNGYINVRATRNSPSLKIPVDEYVDEITHDEFDYAFRQMVGENKNIKNENIMKLNKTKLQETVEKIVGSLLKEETANSWNDLIKIRDNARKNGDEKVSEHASMLLRQLNTAGGVHLMKYEVETFIGENQKYLNIQIEESTYSFDANDPELQQKSQKLQSDSTLFNKDEDEIKINPTNESVITGGQFMKMVNEAKAIRDKNGDYVKAIKKADRETEYDEKGPGWTAKQKIHKNDKKYDRKSFKKSEIIEMFTKKNISDFVGNKIIISPYSYSKNSKKNVPVIIKSIIQNGDNIELVVETERGGTYNLIKDVNSKNKLWVFFHGSKNSAKDYFEITDDNITNEIVNNFK